MVNRLASHFHKLTDKWPEGNSPLMYADFNADFRRFFIVFALSAVQSQHKSAGYSSSYPKDQRAIGEYEN
jgi:hypothetical protein